MFQNFQPCMGTLVYQLTSVQPTSRFFLIDQCRWLLLASLIVKSSRHQNTIAQPEYSMWMGELDHFFSFSQHFLLCPTHEFQ